MIRRLTIKNFLALSALEVTLSPKGALIEGGNGRGKTTVLKAIKAALDGAGISGEAVRKGESAAEILIDLDDETVRRRITAAGKTTLVVEDVHGSERKKPVAFLSALLDLAVLDPLDLFLAGPADRRALVLRAVPCQVTPEQLQPYLPPWFGALTVNDCAGHGLDVVELLRGNVASQRTALGRDVKDAKAASLGASRKVIERAEQLGALGAVWTKEEAAQRLLDATMARAEIAARADGAARAAEALAGQRARAEKLRTQAAKVRQAAPITPSKREIEDAAVMLVSAANLRDACTELVVEQERAVQELERQLNAARAELDRRVVERHAAERIRGEQETAVKALEQRSLDAQAAFDKALDLDAQAEEMLAGIAALKVGPPSDEERAAAEAEYSVAEQAVRAAHEAERARADLAAAHADATAKVERERLLAERYEVLDGSVKALTNDVPRMLLGEAAAAFPGLTITGETILVDDGKGAQVAVECLSMGAQMTFALGVTKRLNAKSKLLFVDGLERLDAEHLRAFVEIAIAEGYQLFATRVTSGPLAITPVTAEGSRCPHATNAGGPRCVREVSHDGDCAALRSDIGKTDGVAS